MRTLVKTVATIALLVALFAAYKYLPRWWHMASNNSYASRAFAEGRFNAGDLIFQTSLSAQSLAIQAATHSPYSHCGIIYKGKDGYVVYEAVQPVKLTPLGKWIQRGKDQHFVVKRLKQYPDGLPKQTAKALQLAGTKFIRKNYDLTFDWSDDRIYCSELIWKVYDRGAGIKIGKLQTLHEFDLSHPAVKAKMKERYGQFIPLNETVISPAAIYNSDLLYTVIEG